eukprot:GSMAST32.ASY1.ANO1.2541.1 assembled CDS
MAEITEDDSYWKATEEIMSALKTQEAFSYGEGLNMLEHALQAAFKAKQAGEPNDVQLACLCHDVGNSPQARAHWVHIGNDEPELIISKADTSIGYQNHDIIGGSYLASLGFSIEVSGLHVEAKRALVFIDKSYMKKLSQASKDTLIAQGGPLNSNELDEFLKMPGAKVALRLRKYDDQGKDINGVSMNSLVSFKQNIYDHLRNQRTS